MDWPRSQLLAEAVHFIGAGHPWSLGYSYHLACGPNPLNGSVAWPAANRAILLPLKVPMTLTAYQMTVGFGASAGGNFDVGIYDASGNRLVSSGSTARTASTGVTVNITDTVLGPGLYYMALALDGTNTVSARSATIAGLLGAVGIRQASTAFVLPSTVTFETAAAVVVPAFGIWLRSE